MAGQSWTKHNTGKKIMFGGISVTLVDPETSPNSPYSNGQQPPYQTKVSRLAYKRKGPPTKVLEKYSGGYVRNKQGESNLSVDGGSWSNNKNLAVSWNGTTFYVGGRFANLDVSMGSVKAACLAPVPEGLASKYHLVVLAYNVALQQYYIARYSVLNHVTDIDKLGISIIAAIPINLNNNGLDVIGFSENANSLYTLHYTYITEPSGNVITGSQKISKRTFSNLYASVEVLDLFETTPKSIETITTSSGTYLNPAHTSWSYSSDASATSSGSGKFITHAKLEGAGVALLLDDLVGYQLSSSYTGTQTSQEAQTGTVGSSSQETITHDLYVGFLSGEGLLTEHLYLQGFHNYSSSNSVALGDDSASTFRDGVDRNVIIEAYSGLNKWVIFRDTTYYHTSSVSWTSDGQGSGVGLSTGSYRDVDKFSLVVNNTRIDLVGTDIPSQATNSFTDRPPSLVPIVPEPTNIGTVVRWSRPSVSSSARHTMSDKVLVHCMGHNTETNATIVLDVVNPTNYELTMGRIDEPSFGTVRSPISLTL